MPAAIHTLLAPNPGLMTGRGTNTHLVVADSGEVAVIDPGPDDSRHLVAIIEAASRFGQITSILVTHGHSDHLPAARPLSERTGAPILGHTLLAGRDLALADQQRHSVGTLDLVALDTPGHTDDSLCFWMPAERILFTGDVIAGAGSVIVDDQPGRLTRYLASLDRLAALGPCTIYPGHGPTVVDGPAKIEEYILHRLDRDAQILDAVRGSSGASVDHLVRQVYRDVHPGLSAMAARNVRAHLDRLRATGRVSERDSLWYAT